MASPMAGKAVLITGGTMGIGLATGLAFGRWGARCILTHKWGSADEDDIRRRFAEAGALAPRIVRADVSRPEETEVVMQAVREDHDRIEAFVSNVSVAALVGDMADYKKRALLKSVEYTAWPMVDYTFRIREAFGRYPRYVVGLSSNGPNVFFKNYDFVAAAKSVMETLCRYLNYRLFDEDVRVNVVRSRFIRTESLRATFGEEFETFAERFDLRRLVLTAEEVANVVTALCSGLLDGVSGQIILVDRGTSFCDNVMRLYNERDELGL